MSIVSSTHELDQGQPDGRNYVTETHTDHLGNVYKRSYLASASADYVALRTSYAAVLVIKLAEAEAAEVMA